MEHWSPHPSGEMNLAPPPPPCDVKMSENERITLLQSPCQAKCPAQTFRGQGLCHCFRASNRERKGAREGEEKVKEREEDPWRDAS